MIKYIQDQFGVVHQVPPVVTKKYNPAYIKSTYGLRYPTSSMASLRIAFICRVLKRRPDPILDVGYADGAFLRSAHNMGWRCYGTDIAHVQVPEGCKFLSWRSALKQSYGLVTFYDSLEHIPDLGFLELLRTKNIIVTAPYYRAEGFYNWKHRKPGEHLHHFCPESLMRFMRAMGYDQICTGDPEDEIRGKLHGKQNTFTSVFEKCHD